MKKYIVLLFLGIAITANAQYIMLDVNGILAAQDNWCWAASSKCILDYYCTPQYQQCDIAEYVRTSGTTFHNYGTIHCCTNPNFGCTQGAPLNGQRGSIQDILCKLGEIRSNGSDPLNIEYIVTNLELHQPFVIGLQSPDHSKSHVMVGYGIIADRIYFMDPDDTDDGIRDGYGDLPYNVLLDNAKYEWYGTLITSSSRGVPCCCNNGYLDADKGEEGVDCGDVCGVPCGGAPEDHCKNHRRDPNLGETGIDCGGNDCPACTPCNNCILDEGEDAMDCGGECTPCKYVGGIKDELNITTTAELGSEMKAFNKITAGGATTVASGKYVTFITEPTGSIFLLPGFKVENGATFRTQRKNLNKRFCGGSICHDYILLPGITVPPDKLYIYNLNYAVEMKYNIYKINETEPIFYYCINVNHDGDFILWDGLGGTEYNGQNVPTGRKYYKLKYTIYYCNGSSLLSKEHDFYVDYDFELSKDSEDPEDLDTHQSSSSDNLIIQDKKSAPSLSIIPNPNLGTFQLETNFPLSNIGNLKITNLMGIMVYETQKVTSPTIQLQNPTAGTFFVVIILKDGAVLTRKMVVQ